MIASTIVNTCVVCIEESPAWETPCCKSSDLCSTCYESDDRCSLCRALRDLHFTEYKTRGAYDDIVQKFVAQIR